jgi:hypothetical protein
MILRVWRGWALPEHADEFERTLRGEIIPGIVEKAIPGFHGIDVLRRQDGDMVQFTTQMWFASLEAVKGFAGEDYEQAVIHPEGGRLLKEYDERSVHHEVRSLLAPPPRGGASAVTELLAAPGPAPDRVEKMQLFGQLVGSWDFDWTGFSPDDGSTQTASGEWHFGWALEGRAVHDVYIAPPLARRDAAPSVGEYGETMRFYDPAIDAWRVAFSGVQAGTLRTFEARQVGDEIVMECTNSERPMKWIFSEITLDSFHWRSEEQSGDGGTWRLREEMDVRRRRG